MEREIDRQIASAVMGAQILINYRQSVQLDVCETIGSGTLCHLEGGWGVKRLLPVEETASKRVALRQKMGERSQWSYNNREW